MAEWNKQGVAGAAVRKAMVEAVLREDSGSYSVRCEAFAEFARSVTWSGLG